MSRSLRKRRSLDDGCTTRGRVRREAIKILTPDIVPVLENDIDDIISQAHAKHLIGDGHYRQSLSITPESNSLKTRKLINVITSKIVFDSGAYHDFLDILRTSMAFEPIADKIEEKVNSLRDTPSPCSTPSSPASKKPRIILHEIKNKEQMLPLANSNIMGATGKENLPHSTSTHPQSDICAELTNPFFQELKMQHQKQFEEVKKFYTTSRKSEVKLKQDIGNKDEMIAVLRDTLHRNQVEKQACMEELHKALAEKQAHTEELQIALAEKQARMQIALAEIQARMVEMQKALEEKSADKKSKTKSRAPPDKRQRRLSSVGGTLGIDENELPIMYRTPPPPYSVT